MDKSYESLIAIVEIVIFVPLVTHYYNPFCDNLVQYVPFKNAGWFVDIGSTLVLIIAAVIIHKSVVRLVANLIKKCNHGNQ